MATAKDGTDRGRPKSIKSVDHMKELWSGYRSDLEERAKKWLKVQYVGKEGKRVTDGYRLPLTMEGFKRYCFDLDITVEHYFKNTNDAYIDFCTICSHITNEIREDQVTGGILGLFNPSITQRLNNIRENVDVTSAGEKLEAKETIIQVTVVPPSE